MTTSLYLRPLLAMSDGFVVTPSTSPMACASRISPTSPVSMKNFIWTLPRAVLGNGLEPLCRYVVARLLWFRCQLLAQLGARARQLLEPAAGARGFVGDARQLVGERHTQRMYGS